MMAEFANAKYIVCGGRDFFDAPLLYARLDFFNDPNWWQPIGLIIEGGATGADTLSRYWAKHNKIEYKTYKADWEKYGKQAGTIRNELMLKTHPDIDGVIAFPTGGPGTAHMMRIAKAAGKLVFDCSKEADQRELAKLEEIAGRRK